jgi:flagellar M-ring protein FliF
MNKFKATVSKGYVTVKDKWTGIPGKTRIVILAVALVVIVSAIVLTAILNRTSMVHLANAANREEAVAIEGALAEAGISDTRVNRNHEVFVNERDRGQALVAISEAGLPRPRANNDIWNNSIGMFSTDSDRREAQRLQLQDWIVAYLREIPQVDHAQVILHIPQTRNFVMVQNREVPRASVMVKLRPETTLRGQQIEGIHLFVLNSVPGLAAGDITVTDGNGIPLFPGDDDPMSPDAALSLQHRRLGMEAAFRELIAQQARHELQPGLELVFGANNYVIWVNADVDFRDNHYVENEVWEPIEGTIHGVLRRRVEQWAVGGTAEEGGVVGIPPNADIAPNYPTFPNVSGGDEFFGEGRYESDYEITRRFETFLNAGMRINEIGATVIVNREPMTEFDNDRWTRAISRGTGAAPENVEFIQTIFAPPPPLPPEVVREGIWSGRNMWIWMIAVLGILLIVLLILAITTSNSQKKRLVRARGFAPAADGPTGYLRDDSFAPLIEEHEGFDLPSLLDENETKDVVLKREIREFTRSNPEIIAQLIRTWLRDEE